MGHLFVLRVARIAVQEEVQFKKKIFKVFQGWWTKTSAKQLIKAGRAAYVAKRTSLLATPVAAAEVGTGAGAATTHI